MNISYTNGIVAATEQWYRKYCNIIISFSKVRLPKPRNGWHALFIPQGIGPKEAYTLYRRMFPCTGFDDMNMNVACIEQRFATQSYAILVPDEPEENGNVMSASEEALDFNTTFMTLTERLLYGAQHWSKTGEHLDTGREATLCATLNAQGNVPSIFNQVEHLGIETHIVWYPKSQARGSALRVREVLIA